MYYYIIYYHYFKIYVTFPVHNKCPAEEPQDMRKHMFAAATKAETPLMFTGVEGNTPYCAAQEWIEGAITRIQSSKFIALRKQISLV